MKKRFFETCGILLLLFVIVTGCGNKETDGAYQIYYLNMDITKTVAENVDLQEKDEQKLAEEMLKLLQADPKKSDSRRAIPEDIKVGKPELNAYQVTVDLSKEYYQLSQVERVLTRAAIVKTLTQIRPNLYVTLTVGGKQMINDDESYVRSMNKDSFVENPGKQINSSNYTVLNLYFANKEGNGLVKEACEVHYSSNISLDKLVMTKLIEGPESKELQATLPSGTKIVMISVADGICYVNLDETFRNDQNNLILEQVVLYSIVNSLTELPEVDKVQISINGDSSGNVRYNCPLSELYESDLTLLETGQTEAIDTKEEEQKD